MSEKSLDDSALDGKYFIDSTVYNCPFCNRRHVRYSVTGHLQFDWDAEKKCHVHTVRCISCGRQSMHLSYEQLAYTARANNGQLYWYFDPSIKYIDSLLFFSVPTSFFTIDTRVPKIIRELVTEAEGSLKMNYLTGASACMRKSIYELLVHQEVPDNGRYKERIKSLKGQHPSIDPLLFDTLGHIQEMTSDKVHEQSWDKWDSPNIRLILAVMKEILREIYVVPKDRRQRLTMIQQLQEKASRESRLK